jgi:hypothetical protein
MKTNRTRFVNHLLQASSVLVLSSIAAAQPAPGAGSTANGGAPIPRMDTPGQSPQGQPPQNQNQRPPQPPKVLPPALPASFVLPAEFRTVDGSANNAANSAWGMPNKPFRRLAPSAYADGLSQPAGATRPSARVVSNAVAAQPNLRPNLRGASDMLWQWGQFLDHDLDETPAADPAEAFPIAIPRGDPQFDPNGTGTVTMGLNRSAYETVAGVREQKSALTAWIDASQVYGSDAVRAAGLRANDGTGRLKTSASANGDLLPLNTGGLANIPPGPTFFVAGDVRVNEQVGLIAIHTLFMREHNFWADLYHTANPAANDEEIYQFARLTVGAELQAITYREFLPVLLGPAALPPYRGYKADVDPTISNEFATAAYRLGHSLLSPTLLRLDAQKLEIAAGNLSLADSFFQPQHITQDGIDVIMRGLTNGRAQELDEWIIDDVRNFLFGAPGAGGLDLASLNIQRGRDHGLPTFAAMRTALKLRPVTRFEDVNRNRGVVQELDKAYESAADIDLWIGGLAEADRAGSMVGEVFQRILVDQFLRLRDGDRFWYEKTLSKELVRMINAQTLSVIIRRNTAIVGAEIPLNAFLAPARAPAGAVSRPKPAKPNQPPQQGGGTPPANVP